MPFDQPDWQLYQSSAAPYIYQESSATPLGKQNIYVGPWRTAFVNASDSGNGDVWDLFLTWANDPLHAQIVQQVPIICGGGVAYAGFVPVLAPYLTVGVSNTVSAVGQSFTGSILPMLLDPPTQGRYLPRPICSAVEQTMNHNNFSNIGPLYISAGPARLTVRSTGYNVTFDLQSMASNGVWNTIERYQNPERNIAFQYEVTLPYNPVRVQVTNSEAFQQIVFDVRLEPL